MTAISLDVPQPALGRGQNAAQFSRAAALAASAAASPARHPGSFSRQTTLAMSALQAQYAEASASALASAPALPSGSGPGTGSQPNGNMRAASPNIASPRLGPPVAPRRRKTSPAPASSRRPSSAPGDNLGGPSINGAERELQDENDRTAVARPAKPLLLRSKSEHVGLRYEDTDDEVDEEHYDFGARHGFEDHYLSEDVIAQLANVSAVSRLRAGGDRPQLTLSRTGTCTSPISDMKRQASRRRPPSSFRTGGCAIDSKQCRPPLLCA